MLKMLKPPKIHLDAAIIPNRGLGGFSLGVSEVDLPPDRLPNLAIAAINVFAVESMTAEGQAGRW